MTDTDIKALVERLRLYQGFEDIHAAADALEALQASRERQATESDKLIELNSKAYVRAEQAEARAEKAEAALLNAQERYIAARNAALEEAAQVAEGQMPFDNDLRHIRDHIAAAIRALKGDGQ